MKSKYLFNFLAILLVLLSIIIFSVSYSGTSILLHILIIIDILVGFVLSIILNIKYVKNKMYISSIITICLTLWFIVLVADYISSFYLVESILGGVSTLIYPILSFTYSLPLLIIVVVNMFFSYKKTSKTFTIKSV